MMLIMSLIVFFRLLSLRWFTYVSPQIKNLDYGLYKYFRVASSLSINWLHFAEGALYKDNTLKLDDLVPSSTEQTSKVCSAQ